MENSLKLVPCQIASNVASRRNVCWRHHLRDYLKKIHLVNKANLVHNFAWYVYFFSLHVSGDCVPIIRRNNCVHATIGACHSVWITIWYEYQSSTQSDKYQASHEQSCFSWWWAHSRPKHVTKRNKHIKQIRAPSWLYLQDYTRTYGEQNIKLTL